MKHDYQTSTVDGAEAFERMYGERSDFEEHDRDDEFDDNDDEEPWDDCNCSDPSCPCSGTKYGRP